jgi:hypothetical protein
MVLSSTMYVPHADLGYGLSKGSRLCTCFFCRAPTSVDA